MSWSYSGNPADSDKDEVRFLVGDTDKSDQVLSDEEINYFVTRFPSTLTVPNWECAAEAARAASTKFTNLVNKSVGSLSLQYGEKSERYLALAKNLDEKAVQGNSQKLGSPVLGGGGDKYLMDRKWFSDFPYAGE